jgi:hypothetical protein
MHVPRVFLAAVQGTQATLAGSLKMEARWAALKNIDVTDVYQSLNKAESSQIFIKNTKYFPE